jgi:uncharacterized membrane protein YjdF
MIAALIAASDVPSHNSVMLLTRREWPIAIFNAIYILAFSLVALRGKNYEFLLYALIVILVAGWILYKQRTVQFSVGLLWCLSVWGLLHMAGGNITINDTGHVLYELQLIPVVLRYDQLVHAFGFGTATLVCNHILRPYLNPHLPTWWPVAILIVLMGSGMGAMNEIIEFIAEKTLEDTHVGGYDNTMLDLVFNLIGGVLAVLLLSIKRNKGVQTKTLDG